ncbi:ABC transporter substrate-binding protein [Bosea thiooxidans]|nr:ABC transporter substrate-binding protein [Bosea sp. (in: a-proteobacteria)]
MYQNRGRTWGANIRCLWMLGCLVAASTPALAQSTVNLQMDGGTFAKAMREAVLDPAEKELGIKISVDSNSGNGIADLRAQVASGRPTIDIMSQGGYSAPMVEKEGLLEPLDYKAIDVSAMPTSSYGKSWVAAYEFSAVLTWNTETLKQAVRTPPTSLAALWDFKTYPGKRAIRRRPLYALEAAMIADGVVPTEVYTALAAPGGIDRAFKKLEELKPHVAVWWTSGAQSAQLMKDAEADLGMLWDGRAKGLKNAGAPVDFTYAQQILQVDCWVIPKGAPNRDAAMKLLAYMMRPEVQARFAMATGGYPPSNPKAYDTGIITSEARQQMSGTPERRKMAIIQDVNWWAANIEAVEKRFTSFLQQ